MSINIETLFNYLEAITPVLNDNQRRHIKMLIDDMVTNSEIEVGRKSWKEGLIAGRKLERAIWSGWAPDDFVAVVGALEDI